jgi:hypothetical protein
MKRKKQLLSPNLSVYADLQRILNQQVQKESCRTVSGHGRVMNVTLENGWK